MNKKFTDKIDKVFEGMNIDSITRNIRKKKEDSPLIVIPKDKSYIEINGYRIDGDFSTFESFIEYLSNVARVEIENELLKTERSEFMDYLKVRLEESKLMATYECGFRLPTIQERVYEDILERIESGNYER